MSKDDYHIMSGVEQPAPVPGIPPAHEDKLQVQAAHPTGRRRSPRTNILRQPTAPATTRALPTTTQATPTYARPGPEESFYADQPTNAPCSPGYHPERRLSPLGDDYLDEFPPRKRAAGSAGEQLAVERHHGSVAGVRRSYLSDSLKHIRRLHVLGRGKVTSTLAAATVALRGSSNGTNDMQRLLTGSVKGRNLIASRDYELLGKVALVNHAKQLTGSTSQVRRPGVQLLSLVALCIAPGARLAGRATTTLTIEFAMVKETARTVIAGILHLLRRGRVIIIGVSNDSVRAYGATTLLCDC
ncbi:hypothetical protein VM1G_11784 [Cytospora mali]|uniref:Uncharacterized protein n=1 Tax=Cytospora mali TaxID=578113 RepID=A0A194W684_CYTMA|nr:hypothetical protein VM1G_11784 [Valsa mali]